MATATTDALRTPARRGLGAVLRRPLAATLVLLIAYTLAAALQADGGYLSSDVGGKVTTLEAMTERGDLSVDIGYWAERWDPAGRFHPVRQSQHIDDQWVDVTTLPMLYLARPLYALGGYHLTLVLPILGAIATAFGARAMATRLAPETDGWLAFWLVALASPVTVYATQLWEHTLGTALVVWGVVGLWDLSGDDRRLNRSELALAAAVGAGFGLAATMRTEALVFGFVATLSAGLRSVRTSSPSRAVALPTAVAAGLVPIWLANAALERLVIGTSLRSGRTSSSASAAGSNLHARLDEAVASALGLFPRVATAFVLVNVAAAVLLAIALAAARRRPVVAMAAGALALCIYLLRVRSGLWFVPGAIATTPVVVVALLGAWRDRSSRWLTGLVLASLPLVWTFQFVGAGLNQWGGRYIMPATVLLVAVAAGHLARYPRAAVVGLVALSAFMSVFGLAWARHRSTGLDDATTVLAARPEPALIWNAPFTPRQSGAALLGERWLRADTAEVPAAVEVLEQAGIDGFGLVTDTDAPIPEVPGYRSQVAVVVPTVGDVALRVVTYDPIDR